MRSLSDSIPEPEALDIESRVHPKFKTTSRATHWIQCDRALVQRGNITLWISEDAIKSWTSAQSGRRGVPRKFSELAIETVLALRLIDRLPLRQAGGFLRFLLRIMAPNLDSTDHTNLSRLSRQLSIDLKPKTAARPIDLIVDSTGLTIVGHGERAARWLGKRCKCGSRKLHIGANGVGDVVAQVLTDWNADDVRTAVERIGQVECNVKNFSGNAAYDTAAIYHAAGANGSCRRSERGSTRRPRTSRSSHSRSPNRWFEMHFLSEDLTERIHGAFEPAQLRTFKRGDP
ncbi:MAG: hypothetical protein ACI87O_001848 [Planctomycetota bacterium]|jgi:hypothetical protein